MRYPVSIQQYPYIQTPDIHPDSRYLTAVVPENPHSFLTQFRLLHDDLCPPECPVAHVAGDCRIKLTSDLCSSFGGQQAVWTAGGVQCAVLQPAGDERRTVSMTPDP